MNFSLIQKIRDIQNKEGNSACFHTGKSQCPFAQTCAWSSLCLHDFEIPLVHLFEVTEK